MDRVAQVDTRLEQFRHGLRQDVLDIALTLQRVMQDVQGQGQGIEQVRHTLFNIAMEKIETLEITQQVIAKTDKQGHEVCTAVGRIINEQEALTFILGALRCGALFRARRLAEARFQTDSHHWLPDLQLEQTSVVFLHHFLAQTDHDTILLFSV